MSKAPEFDVAAAHRYFAPHCFDRAWDLIEKAQRTPQEDEEMLRLSLASHFHWTQRDDYRPKNASIAHWQTSRIYALLRQPENARRHAQFALEASQDSEVEPFYQAYALEAMARAEAIGRNPARAIEHLVKARRLAESVKEEHVTQLLTDLDEVEKMAATLAM